MAVFSIFGWVLRAFGTQRGRRAVHTCLLALGVVVQGVLLLTVAYLTDLSLSLMELWAELARKHLELTL